MARMTRSRSLTAPLAAAGLAAGLALAGCAATPAHPEEHSHTTTDSMDVAAHCEKHRKMMSGQPSAQQQAMMQEHMKSMPPEMRQRMQAMHEKCQ